MSLSRRRLMLWLIRTLVLVGAVACFVATSRYFDSAMPYVAETSSNPHPSETAKAMGPHLLGNAGLFFKLGIGGVAILIATLFIGKKRK